ncbi:MAG: hypothetical protein ABIQ95_01355 [Bdellovibrionia bacterium]
MWLGSNSTTFTVYFRMMWVFLAVPISVPSALAGNLSEFTTSVLKRGQSQFTRALQSRMIRPAVPFSILSRATKVTKQWKRPQERERFYNHNSSRIPTSWSLLALYGFSGATDSNPNYHSNYCSFESMDQIERQSIVREHLSCWGEVGTMAHGHISLLLSQSLSKTPILFGNEIQKTGAVSYILVQCDRSSQISAIGEVVEGHPGESELALFLSRPNNPGGAGNGFLDEWRVLAHSQGLEELVLEPLRSARGFYQKYGFREKN